ncbi:hypothetical protein RND71_026140 [Anisodus tanguticus]|uniref:Uncharacterized protein n=1 Tax=Anisodus tanguticus TaxID=243964 RepID=A0AAE1RMY8_9SOLA|nr:hypothetical protein RND71_026140 [Anisodus tanguticus]
MACWLQYAGLQHLASTGVDYSGNACPAGDAGDEVIAHWLQSAGLHHLASTGFAWMLHIEFVNNFEAWILFEGIWIGAQFMEEKQRFFKLMRNLNLSGESASDPYTPTAQILRGFGSSDGFYFPEFRGDFGAGLLNLHSMDDTEHLTEVSSVIILKDIVDLLNFLERLKDGRDQVALDMDDIEKLTLKLTFLSAVFQLCYFISDGFDAELSLHIL